MITYDVEKQIGNEAKLAFQGLSTDTKPNSSGRTMLAQAIHPT